MQLAYCNECRTRVTVADGTCEAGHFVTTPSKRSTPGRHLVPGSPKERRRPTTQPPVPPLPVAPASDSKRLPMAELLGFTEPSRAVPVAVRGPRRDAPVAPPRPVSVTRPKSAPAPMLATEHATEASALLVARLWQQTAQHDALATAPDWRPDEFSKRATSRRHFRWPLVIGSLVVVAAVAAGGWYLLQRPETEAARISALQAEALDGAHRTLSDLAPLLAAIADPNADQTVLADAAVALNRIDGAARRLSEAGLESPRWVPGFGATAPVGLNDSQELGQAFGDLETGLATVLAYRFAFDQTFALPALPTEATAQEIADLGAAFSRSLASTRTRLEDLPGHSALDGVTLAATELVAKVESRQVNYLSALRSANQSLSGTIAAEIAGDAAALSGDFDTALAALASEIRRNIDDLIAKMGAILDTVH